jgi:hypothetical protein
MKWRMTADNSAAVSEARGRLARHLPGNADEIEVVALLQLAAFIAQRGGAVRPEFERAAEVAYADAERNMQGGGVVS